MYDPMTTNRLALIRQQEILESVVRDRKVRRTLRTLWTALMARRTPPPPQPAPAATQWVKQDSA